MSAPKLRDGKSIFANGPGALGRYKGKRSVSYMAWAKRMRAKYTRRLARELVREQAEP